MTNSDYLTAIDRVSNNKELKNAYYSLLEYMIENNDYGACHSTSAVLYILMSELDFNPILSIGEVKCGIDGHYFDHSWVTLDGLIYDAAIVLPHPLGYSNTGPVFSSIDLKTDSKVNASYGEYIEGLGDDASFVYSLNLGDYASLIYPYLWRYVEDLLHIIGIDITAQKIKNKYKSVSRTLIEKNFNE